MYMQTMYIAEVASLAWNYQEVIVTIHCCMQTTQANDCRGRPLSISDSGMVARPFNLLYVGLC